MTTNAPAKITTLTELLATTDSAIYHSLKTSVYPGASDDSIAMVLAYCRAKKYDPLSKAVYIVPMYVKTGKKTGDGKDLKEWRDVILPGIASYRIDAARTGTYAGINEPEFGPEITKQLGNTKFTFPEYCKITVKKLLNGQVIEFSAIEYWIENYATQSKDKSEPNAMWSKRPRGQLAKCAEAQALRKAFPEAVSDIPTFEEMEGKTLEEAEYERIKNNITEKGIVGTKQSLQLVEKPPSFEDVKAQMEKAKTVDELIYAADLARTLGLPPDQYTELSKIYRQRQKEVKG